jgi:hypothetical protein
MTVSVGTFNLNNLFSSAVDAVVCRSTKRSDNLVDYRSLSVGATLDDV